MVIGGTDKGISFLTLPVTSMKELLDSNKYLVKDDVEDSSAFGDLPSRLQRYFDGLKEMFPDKVDYGECSGFQEAVWSVTRSILYGEVRSYAWVAAQVGKPGACRAVGRALARNRLPFIVPCHRVVARDGTLCGFSGGLGLKRHLLDLEAGRI